MSKKSKELKKENERLQKEIEDLKARLETKEKTDDVFDSLLDDLDEETIEKLQKKLKAKRSKEGSKHDDINNDIVIDAEYEIVDPKGSEENKESVEGDKTSPSKKRAAKPVITDGEKEYDGNDYETIYKKIQKVVDERLDCEEIDKDNIKDLAKTIMRNEDENITLEKLNKICKFIDDMKHSRARNDNMSQKDRIKESQDLGEILEIEGYIYEELKAA